jgi:hypothetical protein
MTGRHAKCTHERHQPVVSAAGYVVNHRGRGPRNGSGRVIEPRATAGAMRGMTGMTEDLRTLLDALRTCLSTLECACPGGLDPSPPYRENRTLVRIGMSAIRVNHRLARFATATAGRYHLDGGRARPRTHPNGRAGKGGKRRRPGGGRRR